MKKVIIDADTGSDDAVALLMAYRNLAKENIYKHQCSMRQCR